VTGFQFLKEKINFAGALPIQTTRTRNGIAIERNILGLINPLFSTKEKISCLEDYLGYRRPSD
jgi:hypothetical protein